MNKICRDCEYRGRMKETSVCLDCIDYGKFKSMRRNMYKLREITQDYIDYLNSQEFLDNEYPEQNLKPTDKMNNGIFDPKYDYLRESIDKHTYKTMKNRFISLKLSTELHRTHMGIDNQECIDICH